MAQPPSTARRTPAVLIVAFGSPELVAEALDALGPDLPVTIVDNSLSEAVRSIAERHHARYVLPTGNLGFAGAVNEGLSHLPEDRDVLLLNPDARLDGASVLRLHDHVGPRVAAVAPLLRRPSGDLERTAWPLPTPFSPWLGAFGLNAGRVSGPDFLSGAVLLLNRDALKQVGLFDTRFFLYAEEADWQRRALGEGWSVSLVPSVQAVHLGGATSTDPELRERLFHCSAELYIRKWYGARGWWVFRLGSLLSGARRWLTARDPAQRRLAALTMSLYVAGPAHALRRSGWVKG